MYDVVLIGGLAVLLPLSFMAFIAINHSGPKAMQRWLDYFLWAGIAWLGAMTFTDVWYGMWWLGLVHGLLCGFTVWNRAMGIRRRRLREEQFAYWQLITMENFGKGDS